MTIPADESCATVTIALLDDNQAERIELSNVASQDVVIDLEYQGTALEGADLFLLPDHATIPAGQTSTTLALATIDDLVSEPDENLTVLIKSAAMVSTDGSRLPINLGPLTQLPQH